MFWNFPHQPVRSKIAHGQPQRLVSLVDKRQTVDGDLLYVADVRSILYFHSITCVRRWTG
jgi:hypothetical protein